MTIEYKREWSKYMYIIDRADSQWSTSPTLVACAKHTSNVFYNFHFFRLNSYSHIYLAFQFAAINLMPLDFRMHMWDAFIPPHISAYIHGLIDDVYHINYMRISYMYYYILVRSICLKMHVIFLCLSILRIEQNNNNKYAATKPVRSCVDKKTHTRTHI